MYSTVSVFKVVYVKNKNLVINQLYNIMYIYQRKKKEK